MKPERWQQVDRIFQEALERAPDDRAAFINEACEDDDSLRREVEALIAADGKAGSLIEAPAYAMAAPLFAGADAPSLVGQSLGHYRLIALLGKGGMGAVYRARDARLSREVAVKILPQNFSQDAERLRRFEREAQAASALNHPNIITIHEIGAAQTETGDTRYIVTEYVAGQTLRQRMAVGKISLSEALDVITQIASALAAAHEAGIVHRDIKPENVMVRPDGLVKVLDFGLAKLAEPPVAEVDSPAPTVVKHSTAPGLVMGTVSYMSPEQARGQKVDGRSDIFSLGVVFYEMITESAPFEGVNALDVVGAILNHEPAPLQQHAPDAPAELQRIVMKALHKDRELRYQHSKDLLLDLKSLKEALEFAAKLKGTQAFVFAPAGGSAPPREHLPAGGTTNAQPIVAATNNVVPARTTSSAEYLINEIKQHKTGVLVGFAVLLACVGGLVYGLYRWAAPEPTVTRFQNVKFTRLTSLGNVADVSISPDGKFIAYVQREAIGNSLWTKAVATGSAVPIVPATDPPPTNTAFSPDGDYVYYTAGPNLFSTLLYRVPTLGGTPRKLAGGAVNSPISFSPTGERIVFMRGNSSSINSELIIANADGTNEQLLATLKIPEQFASPAWSPDGKIIVCPVYKTSTDVFLVAITVDGGKVTAIGTERWYSLAQLSWLPDGSGLVVSARKAGNLLQVWLISYPTGVTRQVTHDLNGYAGAKLRADGRALVALHTNMQANVWLSPSDKPDQARQLTFGTGKAEGGSAFGGGLSWTPDNHILYTSEINNTTTLWTMDTSGGNQRQLPVPDGMPNICSPRLTPDGKYLLFVSGVHNGVAAIWRMNADGTNLRQLASMIHVSLHFSLSPDGRWIAYTSTVAGQGIRLWKVSIDGGEPIRLTDFRARWASISPDGQRIACFYSDEGLESPLKYFGWIPFEGGPATPIVEPPRTARFVNYEFKWMPDGRAIAFLDERDRVNNIWTLPLGGGEPRPLTHFKTDGVYAFAWSPNGKWLALSRGSQMTDVVLISEAR
jgi:eukaryotic-like serine/threonine-protein kinase